MNKPIVEKSQETKLDKLITQFKFLDETITSYELMKNKLENEIVNLLESMELNKYKDVRLTDRQMHRDYSIKDLKELFNNTDESSIFTSLIVKLDIEKSLEALKYEINLQEPIIQAIEYKLKTLSKLDKNTLIIDRKG